ncbi:EAL domain-containing protein [Solibacillus sp. CAU 1738]|uniref:EAL domain-containing protein n=1 Tax=Solibacillus sp. CAU 1738 TaxID=3140363 RepID=UPI00326046F9
MSLQIYNVNNKLLEEAPFPSFVIGKLSQLIKWSDKSEQFFGYSADDFVQNPAIIREQFFSPVASEILHDIVTTEVSIRLDNLQLLTKTEELVDVSIITKPCLFDGQLATLVMCLPIQEMRMLSNENQELIDLKKGIMSSFMVVTLDYEGFITHCNPLFLKMSHWTPKRVLGKTFWQLFPDTEASTHIAQTIWRTLNNGNVWQGEVQKAKKDGQTYWTHLTAIPTADHSTKNSSFILIEKDITKDKTIQLQLEKIAYIDTETGFMNVHRLEHITTKMIEEGRHFSFVYMSIDKFYTLKDMQNGDPEHSLIVEFTKRMKMYFQDSTMARINENDFVVITPLPEWFIQGFLTYMQQHPIYNGNVAVPISISGGITRSPEDQSTFAQLMKASLAAIINVREAGGDSIVSLSKENHKALYRKSLIEKRLLLALDQKNLKVLYQPQLDMKTGKIVAVEALVRWEDEEIGVVSPDELIPVAEETGLIHNIGSFMLEKACEQALAWNAAGIPLRVSINSSVREFRDKNMARSIIDTLVRTNCPGDLIQIEITEKFALEAEGETSIIKQMRQLEREGIVFALDDFGTGYASFRYMQLLPIEILKIDQTFTNSLLKSEKSQLLMHGMIQFGKSMNLTVLAEGVETAEQQKLLKSFGCDLAQGFYISKPITAAEVTKFYNSTK